MYVYIYIWGLVRIVSTFTTESILINYVSIFLKVTIWYTQVGSEFGDATRETIHVSSASPIRHSGRKNRGCAVAARGDLLGDVFPGKKTSMLVTLLQKNVKKGWSGVRVLWVSASRTVWIEPILFLYVLFGVAWNKRTSWWFSFE